MRKRKDTLRLRYLAIASGDNAIAARGRFLGKRMRMRLVRHLPLEVLRHL